MLFLRRKMIDWRTGGLMLFALLLGCQQENTFVAPPPPKVTVAEPLIQEVTDYLEFTGTTVSSGRVEVPARVSGILQSMHFRPGEVVEQGELLFTIDPREYAAEVQASEAELAAAKAELKRAQTELTRARRLYKQKAGSEADVVKWVGEEEVARASILRAEAKIVRAQLNLSYTEVTAPISGRVSRDRVDVGNLVGEGEATVLTDVTQYDPMYVYFNLNERDLLQVMNLLREKAKEKGLDFDEDVQSMTDVPLYLGLANEEGFPHEGAFDFGDSEVDTQTGTMQLRGSFENRAKPTPYLLPGLFTRVRLPIGKRADLPLVTERAIGADQAGRFVLVVNSENMVEKRPIRQGQLIDGMQVIEKGVKAGDRVIVKGLQRARPGAEVNPEQIDMASLSVSAQRAAAQAEQAEQQPAAQAEKSDN